MSGHPGSSALAAAELGPDSTPVAIERWVTRHLADYLGRELDPGAVDRDRHARALPREVFSRCAELGLLAYLLPPPLGLGGSRRTFGLLLEQIGRVCEELELPSLLSLFADLPGALSSATPEIVERYVGGAARGEVLLAFAYTERCETYEFETRARPRGDDWVLEGHKVAQTGGALADAFVVYARDDTDRLQAFLVDRDAPGLHVEPVWSMGFRAGGMTAMTLEDVVVPASHRVIPADGLGQVQAFLNARRIFICAAWPGRMQALLDTLIEFLQGRIRQGVPLTQMQTVQSTLGRMYARTRAARAVLHDALERMASGEHRLAFDPVLSAAKYTVVDHALAFANDALHLTGWSGYTDQLPFERTLRGFMGGIAGQTTQEVLLVLLGQAAIAELEIRRSRGDER
ncbi:acyl-CoA dehydrogenase family protein [Paraliomyxa miuraensis]|uniref:acyl-CoA dehydrogenase family protein n=1 Tax=Paraliomyxa miuraensis TaxID=376150 RepID=UPI00225A0629|nr:acyl-CoA dehydrogenase [Paraliomyxa miuraensis]